MSEASEETAEQARARADQAEADLQELLAVLSHDLGAPLRHVVAFGGLLLEADLEAAGPRARGFAERMVHAGEKMQGMLDGLLLLSRVESRGGPMQAFDGSRVLALAVAAARARLEQLGGSLTADSLPPMHGDGPQIAQLVGCLLDNAIHFRREDAPPHVTLHARPEGASVVLAVEDNGRGFDDSRFARLLLPFRSALPGVAPGPGMGLAIADRIARRHGTELEAESAVGVGSTVSLRLPLAPPSET